MNYPILSWPLFNSIAFGILLAVVALLVGAVLIIRRWFHQHSKIDQLHAWVHLLVSMPKEVAEPGQAQRDWREILATYETLYTTLGGITYRPGGAKMRELWWQFWNGRHDHIVFEIVARQGQIFFYVVAPRALRQLLESQILAQYPKAQIEETGDYNIFGPNSFVQGTVLKLTKPAMYSIRTYKKLDSDPLNAITMALGKVQPGEGAVIQVSIRPKRRGWEKAGLHKAKLMQEGKEKRGASSGGVLGVLGASFKNSSQDQYQNRMPNITPQEQELIKSLEEKAGKPGFETNIRIVTSSPNERNVRVHLENIVNAFTQFHAPESGASFKRGRVRKTGSVIWDTIWRNFNSTMMVLNSEEVNSLYHFPLSTMETPNIAWLAAQQAAAPVALPTEGIILGHNVYRGQDLVVKIKPGDRRRHVYVVGTTGVGKSYLMANMAVQDIARGEGVCVVDPHGDLIKDVLERIPPARMHDVIIFNPADLARPMGLNMLEAHTPPERDAAAQEMVAIFMKLFPPEMIGPMFEHNMRNAMLTLMEDEEYPGTIADIPRIFTDKSFQQYKLTKVKDPVVRAFWEKEMAKTSDFHKSEMLGYLISKVGRFVENAMMRNIIGQPKSAFNFRKIMDEKKILLVNLS
ncbi:MAG: type IV secretion system DNA-binding domain-containing protein, partial [Patescibacteria group bacterium]